MFPGTSPFAGFQQDNTDPSQYGESAPHFQPLDCSTSGAHINRATSDQSADGECPDRQPAATITDDQASNFAQIYPPSSQWATMRFQILNPGHHGINSCQDHPWVLPSGEMGINDASTAPLSGSISAGNLGLPQQGYLIFHVLSPDPQGGTIVPEQQVEHTQGRVGFDNFLIGTQGANISPGLQPLLGQANTMIDDTATGRPVTTTDAGYIPLLTGGSMASRGFTTDTLSSDIGARHHSQLRAGNTGLDTFASTTLGDSTTVGHASGLPTAHMGFNPPTDASTGNISSAIQSILHQGFQVLSDVPQGGNIPPAQPAPPPPGNDGFGDFVTGGYNVAQGNHAQLTPGNQSFGNVSSDPLGANITTRHSGLLTQGYMRFQVLSSDPRTATVAPGYNAQVRQGNPGFRGNLPSTQGGNIAPGYQPQFLQGNSSLGDDGTDRVNSNRDPGYSALPSQETIGLGDFSMETRDDNRPPGFPPQHPHRSMGFPPSSTSIPGANIREESSSLPPLPAIGDFASSPDPQTANCTTGPAAFTALNVQQFPDPAAVVLGYSTPFDGFSQPAQQNLPFDPGSPAPHSASSTTGPAAFTPLTDQQFPDPVAQAQEYNTPLGQFSQGGQQNIALDSRSPEFRQGTPSRGQSAPAPRHDRFSPSSPHQTDSRVGGAPSIDPVLRPAQDDLVAELDAAIAQSSPGAGIDDVGPRASSMSRGAVRVT
jgi:hypothetical protein